MKAKETLEFGQNLLKETIEQRDGYQQQLNMSKNCLIKCNYILTCGVKTVGVNNENQAILTNTLTPMQFSENQANKLVKDLKPKNIYGDVVKVKKVFYKAWYESMVEKCNSTIKTLETALANN